MRPLDCAAGRVAFAASLVQQFDDSYAAPQNIVFEFAEVAGMSWTTSQCSTTLRPRRGRSRQCLPRLARSQDQVRVGHHDVAFGDHALDVQLQLRVLPAKPTTRPPKNPRRAGTPASRTGTPSTAIAPLAIDGLGGSAACSTIGHGEHSRETTGVAAPICVQDA